MLICHCASVNDRRIRELGTVEETVAGIGSACGAGQDCGSCVGRIEAILGAMRSPQTEVATQLKIAV